jgi:hypothetical protein
MARRFPFPMEPGACHARSDWNDLEDGSWQTVGSADHSGASIRAVRICSKTADQREMTRLRDHVGVMLHLRSLYVSKAAILTI